MRTCLYIIIAMFLLTSCGTSQKNASPSPQNNRGMTVQSDGQLHNNVNNTTGNEANQQKTSNGQDVSITEHLRQISEQIEGVNSANVVMMGNTAVVGINVNGDLDRSRVGVIKYSVAEALRKDPHGANALVTADMDLTDRIAEISQHVKKGHPISGFAAELADVVGRIVPQLPRDTTPRNNGKAE